MLGLSCSDHQISGETYAGNEGAMLTRPSPSTADLHQQLRSNFFQHESFAVNGLPHR